ncbi:5-(carboxyamino)imidazole ribonucleotide mutase [Methanocalculus sp.]|uniref:5-(carboxyamino)imidazole ribonucleotide mutase n=1 Tax=Methanocalculus sp. TaxID=2004547 RepID=UPI002608319C|nr:5-(carboxyamino)imidazole ribonucleotide mutase [Methanocalculus sp.]MDG6249236.1 5-(carboxyamino)imidazole ribonucleotide mutase [Methanocalculus sp.]
MVDVAVIAGSQSDEAIVRKVCATLDEYGLSYEEKVISAHRDPELLVEYVRASDAKVFIGIAGMSAALPGVIASKTKRPVIGVPVAGKQMGGLDALLSIVQMPKGVPVACVAVDGGENAAHLAARIIGVA